MRGEPTLTPAEEKFFSSKGAEAPEAPATADPPAPERKTEPEAKVEAPKEVDPKPEKEAQPGGDKGIALHEERTRRKAVEKERDEFKTNFTKLQSRLDTLTEIAKASTQPQKQEVAPEIPDINTDPVGHFKAKDAIRERELADLRTWRQGQEQQSQAVNNVQRIAQLAQNQEREFIKTQPDYMAASEHLKSLRDAQLVAYGVSDPNERANIIAQDAITIAANALSQNKNPAQVIWDMAAASGYKAGAVAKQPEPGKANGMPTEAEKVAMAAAGQKSGGSLGQMSGTATAPTTAAKLLEMDEDEFAEATKGNNWRKLVEGLSR